MFASPSIRLLTLSLGLPEVTATAIPARASFCAACLTGACNNAGLPYAWINLQHGLLDDDSTETNTAAAGSFTLELGLLSRLTGEQSEGAFCATLPSGLEPDSLPEPDLLLCNPPGCLGPDSLAVACCCLRQKKKILQWVKFGKLKVPLWGS